MGENMKLKKQKKYEPQLLDDQNSYSIKSMIIIILIIVVILVGFYFLTTVVVENKQIEEEPVVNETYQSEKILFSQVLNRKESEYYVYAYDKKSKFYELYEKYFEKYNEKEDKLEIYEIDMNDGMNKEHIGDKTIIEEDNIVVSEATLFKVKNGKLEKYFANHTDIINELKRISE